MFKIIFPTLPITTLFKNLFSLSVVNNNWPKTPPESGIIITNGVRIRNVVIAGIKLFPNNILTTISATIKIPKQLGIEINKITLKKSEIVFSNSLLFFCA